jgi:transcriptional regulator with XRE-family HTH domain
LLREEVAILAGVSPTWYTYLEQGRDIHPSPAVLDSIARVLRLTEDERRYVHTLAYGQIIWSEPLNVDLSSRDVLGQLVAVYQESPYPVYVGDHCSDLIAWNHAATEWYDDWSQLPSGHRNMLRWMLTSPTARDRLVDWERDTQDIVARLRAEAAKWPEDQRLQRRVRELSGLNPQFVHWWKDHDVQGHRIRTRRFRHPRFGVQMLRLVPLHAPEFSPFD